MTEQTQNNGSKNKTIIILLVVLLLGSGGLSIWQFTKTNNLQKQLEAVEKERDVVLSEKNSLELELNDLEQRLLQLEAERADLANYAGTLEGDIEKLQKTISGLRSRLAKASPEEIARLKREVAELSNQTRNYEEELSALKAENEELRKRGEELTEENKTLAVINETLDTKVKKASVAQYAPIKVTAGRMRKKGFSPETKVRRIEEIRIDVDVVENPIINTASEQSIAIRIIDPEKAVLAKVQDNKSLVDKSEIYTIKHNYSFDGKAKKINLSFTPETRLIKGIYKVEFWADGAIKQTQTFELN